MILLDFETRSKADLKKVGGRNYAAHPSTELVCCVATDTQTRRRSVALPGDPAPWDPDQEVGAHNWDGFDRFIAARLGWNFAGQHDTASWARRAGLPGALDALGTRWLGSPKDEAGSKLTRALSGAGTRVPKDLQRLMRDYRRTLKKQSQWPAIPLEVFARVVEYCENDVTILEETHPRLSEFKDFEPEVAEVNRTLNDRGIHFDSDLARAMLKIDDQICEVMAHLAARQLGGSWTPEQALAAASSPAQFTDHTGLPNAQRAIVELSDHPLAKLRLATASIARGKLKAGLARVSPDGILRDNQLYLGAHTWRWTSKGMQLHNLPRPPKKFDKAKPDDVERLIEAIKAGDPDCIIDTDALTFLVRATLTAGPGETLAVADYSGVEARALAWVSGDHKAIEVFKSGRSPYLEMAAAIFGVPYSSLSKEDWRYTIGKAAVLACGYQMGPANFNATALKNGTDLEKLGLSPVTIVKAWRKLHNPSVQLWYDVEDAMRDAALGVESRVACFDFVCGANGHDVAVFLPSGRPIVYNDVRLHHNPERNKPSIMYRGHRSVESIYGGMIVENLIQGLCRDLLADSLVRAERAGLNPCLTVHDEIVARVPKSAGKAALDELLDLMKTLPAWANGFPVDAAGYVGERYRK